MDPGGFDTWVAMLHVHVRLLVTLERGLLDRSGLTLSAFEVLATLNRAPDGRLRMQHLAEAVVMSNSGATRTVASLAARGLVDRLIPADDRRVTYAVITDAGRRRFAEAAPGFFARVHHHFGRHLHPGDAGTLQGFLHRVAGEPIGHARIPRPPVAQHGLRTSEDRR